MSGLGKDKNVTRRLVDGCAATLECLARDENFTLPRITPILTPPDPHLFAAPSRDERAQRGDHDIGEALALKQRADIQNRFPEKRSDWPIGGHQ